MTCPSRAHLIILTVSFYKLLPLSFLSKASVLTTKSENWFFHKRTERPVVALTVNLYCASNVENVVINDGQYYESNFEFFFQKNILRALLIFEMIPIIF